MDRRTFIKAATRILPLLCLPTVTANARIEKALPIKNCVGNCESFVNQVVSMNVPEGVLLHARVLVPINVHLHVLRHVGPLVSRRVGRLVMVAA